MAVILRDVVVLVSDEPDTETGLFNCMLVGKLPDRRMVSVGTVEGQFVAAETFPELRLEIERLDKESRGYRILRCEVCEHEIMPGAGRICKTCLEEVKQTGQTSPAPKPRKHKLTKAERSKIAKRAAQKRWAKKKAEEEA